MKYLNFKVQLFAHTTNLEVTESLSDRPAKSGDRRDCRSGKLFDSEEFKQPKSQQLKGYLLISLIPESQEWIN